ncbi:MAG: hypothetical protein AAGF84_07640 [Planctomycetota bacterium]
MPAPSIPRPTVLLCENCGYPLSSLDEQHACPECGTPAVESDPARRIGPLWHNRPGPGAWIDIALALLTKPGRFFRDLKLGGSNVMPRLFLLSIACLVGGGWALSESLWNDRHAPIAWGLGMLAAKAVLLLSYLEALGVTFFSWRRGWRVPFRLAERVVCYASFGWVPAAIGLILLNSAWQSGALADAIRPWLPAAGVFPAASLVPAVFIAVGGVLILGFEAWVYVGVRHVRYANPPNAHPSHLKSVPATSQTSRLDAERSENV